MSLWMPESEMGLRAKAKWGLTPVSVQAQVSRPSGLCFIGVRIKAKRNGYFLACHWETLAPRPPEYGQEQEGPVQFQWVTCLTKSTRDSFFCKPVIICTPTNPFKPARLSQPHDGHLIRFIAPRSASVLLSGVSPKNVPLERTGLTPMPCVNRQQGSSTSKAKLRRFLRKSRRRPSLPSP